MRITGFHINGFGLFHDLRVEGLNPQVTLFLGENESGKSTLLGFMRAILFGFPDGRSNENLYPPLAGGKHGGSVHILMHEGNSYVVERSPGAMGGRVKVFDSDHGLVDSAFPHSLLGMANRNLFRNVFGFSLSELQNFDTLSTEAVRHALFSAGAGIDPGKLAKLQASLEKEEGELFKPGGAKPKINEIVSRLMGIQKEKRALQDSIAQYDDGKSRLSLLSAKIRALEDKRNHSLEELRRAEQWSHIWPDWASLSLARQKLGKLEPVIDFPSEGLVRFEGLLTRLQDAQNELMEKEEDLRRQEADFTSLRKDLGILDQTALIREIQREQGNYGAAVREAVALSQEVSSEESRFKEELGRLGSSWSEVKIQQVDISMPLREEIRRYREAFRRSDLEGHSRKESYEHTLSRKREAEQMLKNSPEPVIKDSEHLKAMTKALHLLRDGEAKRQVLENSSRSLKDRLEDLEQQKAEQESGQTMKLSIPLWPVLGIVLAAALFLAWSWSDGMLKVGLPVSGFSLIIALILWLLRRGQEKNERERSRKGETRIRELTSRQEELEGKRKETQQETEEIQAERNAAARVLGLGESVSWEVLEQVEEVLSGHAKTLDQWKKARENLDKALGTLDEARRAFESAEQESQAVGRGWQGLLEKLDLNSSLSPEGALEILSLVQALREQADHLRRLKSRLKSLEEIKEKYVRLVKNVPSTSHGEELKTEDGIQLAVHTIVQDFAAAEEASHKRALLEREMEASRNSIDRLRSQIRALDSEIKTLLQLGGAEDEKEFRRRARSYEERVAIDKDIEKYEDHLTRFSLNLGGMENVKEVLSQKNLEAMEEQKARLEKDHLETEQALEHLKQERTRLEEQIRQLGNEEKTAILREEEENLKEALRGKARQWSLIRLAQYLIRMARTRYEREVQPDVIRAAAGFFRTLTHGRYPSITAPLGEDRIEVICEDSRRKELSQLSRGTAEQLYLSLRFGFIQEYCKRSEALPLVMDEILVNFDSNRAKAAVRVLVELSQHHQILYFTCHSETAMLFREIDPMVPTLVIKEGTITLMKDERIPFGS